MESDAPSAFCAFAIDGAGVLRHRVSAQACQADCDESQSLQHESSSGADGVASSLPASAR